MANGITLHAKNSILNHIFNNGTDAYTPTSVHVALSTSEITLEDGSDITEDGYVNYARSVLNMGASSGRSTVQASTATFPKAGSGPQKDYIAYAIYDAATNGNMLAFGDLTSQISVVENNTASINSGEIQVDILSGGGASGNGMSTYLANKVLDMLFVNTAYSGFDIYIALATGTLLDSDTGSTMTEPADTYLRVNYLDFSDSSAKTIQNNAEITFPTPTASWGTVTSSAILDSTLNGEILFYDNDNIIDQPIGTGDTIKFLSGDLDVSIT